MMSFPQRELLTRLHLVSLGFRGRMQDSWKNSGHVGRLLPHQHKHSDYFLSTSVTCVD